MAAGESGDVDLAVRAARKALAGPGAKWLQNAANTFTGSFVKQERSRELAILETMDGGKPIKESRDVDLPLVAAHFFYHAGWADKLEYAFPGKSQQQCMWTGHTMEFSANDGCLETGTSIGLRQYSCP